VEHVQDDVEIEASDEQSDAFAVRILKILHKIYSRQLPEKWAIEL
jgi:hypothetical protein